MCVFRGYAYLYRYMCDIKPQQNVSYSYSFNSLCNKQCMLRRGSCHYSCFSVIFSYSSFCPYLAILSGVSTKCVFDESPAMRLLPLRILSQRGLQRCSVRSCIYEILERKGRLYRSPSHVDYKTRRRFRSRRAKQIASWILQLRGHRCGAQDMNPALFSAPTPHWPICQTETSRLRAAPRRQEMPFALETSLFISTNVYGERTKSINVIFGVMHHRLPKHAPCCCCCLSFIVLRTGRPPV